MNADPHVIVVGSHGPGLFVHVNRIPVAGETVAGWNVEAPVDGGKGSNQAVAAARQGARVSLVSCVGADELGERSLQWLAEAQVDVRWVCRSASVATAGGFVFLDSSGMQAIISLPGGGAALTEDYISRALEALLPGDILLTQFEIPPRLALYAAQLGRDKGLTTIVNPSPAPEFAALGLEAADVLVANETEALTLVGEDPASRRRPDALAAQVWQRTGAGCVMVTLGQRGAAYAGPDGAWVVPSPAAPVVDTTGAGDAFCGALAVALARGEPKKAAAAWACAAAAYSVTQRGTIPIFPTRAQVESFLAERPGAPASSGKRHETTK